MTSVKSCRDRRKNGGGSISKGPDLEKGDLRQKGGVNEKVAGRRIEYDLLI